MPSEGRGFFFAMCWSYQSVYYISQQFRTHQCNNGVRFLTGKHAALLSAVLSCASYSGAATVAGDILLPRTVYKCRHRRCSVWHGISYLRFGLGRFSTICNISTSREVKEARIWIVLMWRVQRPVGMLVSRRQSAIIKFDLINMSVVRVVTHNEQF
jgi:hypothetical protein